MVSWNWHSLKIYVQVVTHITLSFQLHQVDTLKRRGLTINTLNGCGIGPIPSGKHGSTCCLESTIPRPTTERDAIIYQRGAKGKYIVPAGWFDFRA
jgi:hypothetical protein